MGSYLPMLRRTTIMKAYIYESELWPCLTVSTQPGTHEHEIDAPEAQIEQWKTIAAEFYQMQNQIKAAIFQHEHNQEEIKHLAHCFDNPKPSRTDKGYILGKFGWTQIDTSLWEKNGRQVRLHIAYDECKREFEEQNATG